MDMALGLSYVKILIDRGLFQKFIFIKADQEYNSAEQGQCKKICECLERKENNNA